MPHQISMTSTLVFRDWPSKPEILRSNLITMTQRIAQFGGSASDDPNAQVLSFFGGMCHVQEKWGQ